MKFRFLVTLFTHSLVIFPCVLSAQSKPPLNSPVLIEAGRGSPIIRAAANGDRAILQAESSGNDPASAAMAASLEKRMSGDFAGSARIAESCFRQTADSDSKVAVALACAQIWASDAYLQGDKLQWADITQSTWDKLRPRVVTATGKDNLTTNTLAGARAVHALPDKSAMLVRTDAKITRVPVSWLGRDEGQVSPYAYVEAFVNGKKILMLVDTGAQISALSVRDATAAGIGIKAPRIVEGTPPAPSRNGLGFVKNLRAGNLDARNLRLLVLDANDSVLGMDLLQRMGDAVRIGRNELRILPPDAPEVAACQGDTQILLDVTGVEKWSLTFPVQIDGKSEMPVVDTGNNNHASVFTDDSPLQSTATHVPFVRRTPSENKPMSYTPGKVDIQGGQKKVQEELMILPKAEQQGPRSWSLGSGILNDFDIIMDFKQHHTCLLPSNVPTVITKTQSSRSP